MIGKNSFLILLLLIFACQISASELHYVALNAQGSGNGSSPDNAHSLDWLNTASNWGTMPGQIGPGDFVHLCGTFAVQAGTSVVSILGSGTEGNNITIVFEEDAILTAPYFGGTATGTGGAIYAHSHDYIVIDGGVNGIIESTDNGSTGSFTYTEGNIGVNFTRSDHCQVTNITIRNLYQARNNENPTSTDSIGVSICACNDTHASNNNITAVGHAFRIGMQNTAAVYVHDNTIFGIGTGIFAGLTGDGVTGDDVRFYNNRIYDTSNWGYNDGVKFFGRPTTKDPFTGIKVFNNIIGPNISHSGHPATAWILISNGWLVGPEVYNNLLIGDAEDNASNGYITVGGNGHSTGWTLEQNSKIYNNTIVSENLNTDICICFNKWSTGHNIYNNIAKFTGKLIAIHLNDTNTKVEYSDNNCFYSDTDLVFHDGSSNLTLTEWRTLFLIDFNTISSDPILDANNKPFDNSSPVVNSGKALGQGYIDLDIEGVLRPWGDGWDMGAYEYCTEPPDNLGAGF